MEINFLTGSRFYYAVIAGGESVIDNKDYLNKINVFPVPDSDTGTNLASTMLKIINNSYLDENFSRTISSIAESAVKGARGNSGIIFAQFLVGLSEEIAEKEKVTVELFANAANQAVNYVYESILEPVEGTMITVIREWTESLKKHSQFTQDFSVLFHKALQDAKVSLSNTPAKLKVLAEAGVVDAGAKGFVHFLEGIYDFLSKGKIVHKSKNHVINIEEIPLHDLPEIVNNRYCTEANLSDLSVSIKEVKNQIKEFGDSFIVAGNLANLHLHIHTNNPELVFSRLADFAKIDDLKVDDMQKQFDITHNRKSDIALVTDSACDLPLKYIDDNQIMQISFGITLGSNRYLDKKTITSEQFYQLIQDPKVKAFSNQPTKDRVENIYNFAHSNFKHVIGIHISDKLTGIYKQAEIWQKNKSNSKARIFNSRQLTVAQGLIVKRASEAIKSGIEYDELVDKIDKWIDATQIFVDVATLKYMIKGGRVPKVSGSLADFIHIKPIVSLDKDGKATVLGKSFGRDNNRRKIIKMIKDFYHEKGLWSYAIVHAGALERAELYGRELTKIIGKEPEYISELSPVVGVHNGVGAVAIGIMGD